MNRMLMLKTIDRIIQAELDELAEEIGKEAVDAAIAELSHREDYADILERAARRVERLVSEYMDET